MRAYMLPGTHFAAIGETRDCLLFIIALSVPLSAALIVMLRRAYSLAPPLTAAMVGLASAAAAATLLNFFHPFDATAADLGVHVVAVAIVVAAAQRCRGQRTYRPVQLGVGSSPSGGHSLLARYPETLTSATRTYPRSSLARDVASAARKRAVALSPRPRSSAVRETPIPPAALLDDTRHRSS